MQALILIGALAGLFLAQRTLADYREHRMNYAEAKVESTKPAPTPVATYPSTPSQVVQSFCENDFKGAGLSSKTNSVLFELTSWEDSPGWDTTVVVDHFVVGSPKIKGNEAEVPVSYEVLGSIAAQFSKNQHEEKISYLLNNVKGLWKISKPQIPPHISIEAAKAHLSQLQEGLDEKTGSEERKRLQSIINQLGK